MGLFLLAAVDKKRSKNLSNGNVTVDADSIEPCDHHLDCLPGQAASYLSVSTNKRSKSKQLK